MWCSCSTPKRDAVGIRFDREDSGGVLMPRLLPIWCRCRGSPKNNAQHFVSAISAPSGTLDASRPGVRPAAGSAFLAYGSRRTARPAHTGPHRLCVASQCAVRSLQPPVKSTNTLLASTRAVHVWDARLGASAPWRHLVKEGGPADVLRRCVREDSERLHRFVELVDGDEPLLVESERC